MKGCVGGSGSFFLERGGKGSIFFCLLVEADKQGLRLCGARDRCPARQPNGLTCFQNLGATNLPIRSINFSSSAAAASPSPAKGPTIHQSTNQNSWGCFFLFSFFHVFRVPLAGGERRDFVVLRGNEGSTGAPALKVVREGGGVAWMRVMW